MKWRTRKNLADICFDRILVISLSGLGDTVLATPLCQALRQRYKDARLCGLTMWNTSAAVLRHLGIFDSVISHNFLEAPKMESLRLAWRLRKERFDLSVLIFPSNRAHYNILSWLIHANYRLGHDYHVGKSLAYGRFFLTHRMLQSHGTHNVEENNKLAQILGISCDNTQISIGTLGEDYQGWADSFLMDKSPPYLGIHPGCSPLKNHTRRRWPADKYAKLAHELQHKTGATSLVFLGPDEMELKPTFHSLAPGAAIVSHVSIEKVAALARRCHLFICSDSSMGHMASACGVPVVSILGPTNPDYIRPWQVPHRIVSRQLPCSPCFEYSRHPLQCYQNKNFSCVFDITISSVMDACMSLLDEVQGQKGIENLHVQKAI